MGGKLLIMANGTICLYRFRKELIIALAEYKQVYISAMDDGFAKELGEMEGVTYIETKVNRRKINPFQDLLLLLTYFFMMVRIKPDTVLTYTIKPNIYGNFAARLLNIPVVSTVSGLGDGFLNSGVVGKIVKILFRLAFAKTQTIVFQNTENEDAMRQAGILKNQRILQVTGSGVNLEEREVLDYPDDSKTSFLYIGRIMHSKGIYELINAARRLKADTVYEFDVSLIGFSEKDADELIAKAEEEDVVHSWGFQKEMDSFIGNAHCVVHPSHNEGMSNALLEAAAHGRTLIATDISGCREIVEDGVNGYLCLPKDEDSLYECMKKFLETSKDEKLKMGQASRKKAEDRFNRKTVTDKMLKEVIGTEM